MNGEEKGQEESQRCDKVGWEVIEWIPLGAVVRTLDDTMSQLESCWRACTRRLTC